MATDQGNDLDYTGPPTAPPPHGLEAETEAIRSETGGLAALAAGQEAEATFARAVGHWRQLGLTVWLGRALSLQAAAAVRAGDRAAADHLLAQAAEVFDQLKTPAYARSTVLAPLGERGTGP